MKEVIAQEPSRLDQFIATHFGLSRAQAQKRIEEGLVRCNGKTVRKASKRLLPGDVVSLTEIRPEKNEKQGTRNQEHFTIPVLYEDASCLVVDKPEGLTVHRAPATKETEQTVIDVLRSQHSLPSLCLAHRLDKGTTGCLLIAKTVEACEVLQGQFKERAVEKTYLAIVAGVPEQRSAVIDAPLGRSLVQRTRMTLFRTSKSREAATTYTVLSSSADCSLLECTIATGRTHQIRVHLAAIGHPVLGDEKYGTEQSCSLSKQYGVTLPCLHAWKLTFQSPVTGEKVQVSAPIPEEFRNAAGKTGLEPPEENQCSVGA